MTWTTRPRSDFGQLRAVTAGDGPGLVLLHGVGLRAEAWGAQLDDLADRFSMIAPDMPGHGESTGFQTQSTLQDYTDRVAEAIDAPVCLAGHSMGALIALDLALRYPHKVRAIAALNTIFQRSADASRAVQARAAELDGRRLPDPSPTLARWFGTEETAAASACRDWLTQVDPAGYQAAYRVFAAANGPDPEALCELAAPALFMTGAEEPNSTPAMSQALAGATPGGRAIIVEGAAHMMPMTHAEQINPVLSGFFETVP